MKIKILTLWILSLLCCNAKAQLQPIFNVPSPEVAGLGEYGKVPVSLYTGIPDISIPLYEIKVGNYSLPLSANYHVASVKANAQSGPLGLGWSLFAGGYITRSVHFIPDETILVRGSSSVDNQTLYQGFYYNAGKIKNITPQNVGEYNENAVAYDSYELAADEFSFNFCGYSGNFYINEDGGWSVVSDQKIEVRFDEQDGGFIGVPELAGRIDISNWERRRETMRFFNKFTLLTPDGCQYEFGGPAATEFSISYYNRNKSDLIATTWRLSKITTADKKAIEFTYDTSGILADIKYVAGTTSFKFKGEYNHKIIGGKDAFTGFLLFPVNIKQIKTPNETIDFSYERDDYYLTNWDDQFGQFLGWTNWDQVGRFDLFQAIGVSGRPSEQFHVFMPGMIPVGYGEHQPYINDQAVCNAVTDRLNNQILKSMSIRSNRLSLDVNKEISFAYSDTRLERLKLTAIIEKNTNSDIEGEENPEDRPGAGSRMHKFTYNTKKLPISYLQAGADPWGYYNGGTNTLTSLGWGYDDKSPKADVLSEIKYPTGGKSKFEFEKHQYGQVIDSMRLQLLSKDNTAGGLRIQSITRMDKDDRPVEIKKYYYTLPLHNTGILREIPINTLVFLDKKNNSVRHTSREGFFASATRQNTPDVGYSCVIEETLDGQEAPQGRIRYKFSNYDTDMYGQQHMDEVATYSDFVNTTYLKPYTSHSAERGKLLSEEHFDKSKTLKKTITHHYTRENDTYLKTIHQMLLKIPFNNTYNLSVCSITQTHLYSYLLDKTTETLWEGPTGQEVTKSQTFTYNANKLPSKVVSNTSDGGSQAVEYKYLGDDAAHQWLFQFQGVDHVLTPLVEKKTTKGASTLRERYTYGATNGIPYLRKGETTIGNAYPRTEFTINRVDSWGNPVEVDEKNLTTVMLWGYKGQRLIAKIVNASLSELSLVPSSYDAGETQNIYSQIEGMRKNFPTSQFYIYKYDGCLRLQSASNPNGVSTLFNYDPWGRLTESYYIDGTGSSARKRLLNSYDYFYGPNVVQQ